MVTKALKLIKVLAAEESPTAAEMDDGIETLNLMLHGWALSGVDLGWSDITQTQTINVPDEYLEGILYALAIRLSSEYPNSQVDPVLVTVAQSRFEKMQADNYEIPEVVHDQTLLDTWAQGYGAYNINNE